MSDIVLVPVEVNGRLHYQWRCDACATLDESVWTVAAAAVDDAGSHRCKGGVSCRTEWAVDTDDPHTPIGVHYERRFAEARRAWIAHRQPENNPRLVSRQVTYGPWREVHDGA